MGKRKKPEVVVIDDSEDDQPAKKPALAFTARPAAKPQARTASADGYAGPRRRPSTSRGAEAQGAGPGGSGQQVHPELHQLPAKRWQQSAAAPPSALRHRQAQRLLHGCVRLRRLCPSGSHPSSTQAGAERALCSSRLDQAGQGWPLGTREPADGEGGPCSAQGQGQCDRRLAARAAAEQPCGQSLPPAHRRGRPRGVLQQRLAGLVRTNEHAWRMLLQMLSCSAALDPPAYAHQQRDDTPCLHLQAHLAVARAQSSARWPRRAAWASWTGSLLHPPSGMSTSTTCVPTAARQLTGLVCAILPATSLPAHAGSCPDADPYR